MTFAIYTLGCKVNSYESGIMAEKCELAGFSRVSFNEKADIYIINTCAVTEESVRKSKSIIRRAKRTNPNCIICAVGCYTQQDIEDKVLDIIDIRLGTREKGKIAEYIKEYLEKGEKIVRVYDIKKHLPYEEDSASTNEHSRAFIKVEDGCDSFCSYCLIPYVRGRVSSRDPENTIAEIKNLVKSGYREFVITGIHLDSYGKDFDKEYDLVDLLKEIDAVSGLSRIRLGSLEPTFINEKNVVRLKEIRHLCNHFHLSLQSGDDETLKSMNRKYLSYDYVHAVDLLRKTFGEDVGITTDVIVGFPGEDDLRFNNSASFVKSIGFSNIHIFPYSVREGTLAANMDKQIPVEIKQKRVKVLEEIKKESVLNFNSLFNGRSVDVLIEKTEYKNNRYLSGGHTKNYVNVRIVSYEKLQVSQEYSVIVSGFDNEGLFAEYNS